MTAVDEDEEGGEEAPVPDEFEYHSDNEGEGDTEGDTSGTARGDSR